MTTTSYSHSALQNFQKCALQYFYKNVQHLQKIDDDASMHHLSYGKAMHEGLAVLYKGGSMKQAKTAIHENYPVQLDPNDLAKTAANGEFVLEKYWEHYDCDRNWKVVEVEEMSEADDGFTVKPDLVVRDRNDNLLIVDHKFTKKYLNYDFFAEFDPNSQVTQYTRWGREKFGRVDGFVINAVSLLFLKRKSAQRAAGFNVEFERQVFQRTQQQIDQDEESKKYWIAQIEEARASGVWAMNTTACKFCQYRPLCAAGWTWEEDESLILSTFRQVCDKRIPAKGSHCHLDQGHDEPCSDVVVCPEAVEYEI